MNDQKPEPQDPIQKMMDELNAVVDENMDVD
jgi:hypothetical protein